jgi:hypothetical protein
MAIDAIPWKGHARYSRKYHHGAEAAAGHDDIGTDTIKESWKEQQQKDLGKSTGDDLDHAISLETLRRRHAERVMIIRGGLQMWRTRDIRSRQVKTPLHSACRTYCATC